MSLPVWIDPRTLRWLADEAEREAKDCEAAHIKFVHERQQGDVPAWHREAEEHCRRQFQSEQARARRLRGIATRVERKRA